MSLLEVWCEGSFQGSREENDILRSRGVKALSLGMPPWFIPAYFKKTQASKLGDAQGIPFFINNIIRFLPWNYIFIQSHLMYFAWSVGLFCFCFCLNKMDPSIHCMGERHAPLLHMDKYVLRLYS